MTGKHIWNYPDGIKKVCIDWEWKEIDVIKKCIACGMIDDRKKK